MEGGRYVQCQGNDSPDSLSLAASSKQERKSYSSSCELRVGHCKDDLLGLSWTNAVRNAPRLLVAWQQQQPDCSLHTS